MENPFDKLSTTSREQRRQQAEDRLADAASFSTPERRASLPEITTPETPVSATLIVTSEDLRRKAQQCRTEAESFTIPELRAHLLEIAAEYERLAIRGEQFEARSRLPTANPMNAIAVTHWFG